MRLEVVDRKKWSLKSSQNSAGLPISNVDSRFESYLSSYGGEGSRFLQLLFGEACGLHICEPTDAQSGLGCSEVTKERACLSRANIRTEIGSVLCLQIRSPFTNVPSQTRRTMSFGRILRKKLRHMDPRSCEPNGTSMLQSVAKATPRCISLTPT